MTERILNTAQLAAEKYGEYSEFANSKLFDVWCIYGEYSQCSSVFIQQVG